MPLVAAALALLAGCASTSPTVPYKDVSQAVDARSGQKIRWNQATDDDKEAEAAIDRLLGRPLTADAAVQIALLSNPSLQAKLEELAISQAELVQAGLLDNPTFTIGRTAWESEHLDPNLFASVEQNFLNVVTMPMRKRVAATELEATKLDVGDHVLELAAHVREAFYTAQAAEQVLAMRTIVEEASKASAELARLQHEAGNMNDLTLSGELGLAAQTTLDRRRAEGEAAVAREKLNKLMGLWGPRTAWKMAPKLPSCRRRSRRSNASSPSPSSSASTSARPVETSRHDPQGALRNHELRGPGSVREPRGDGREEGLGRALARGQGLRRRIAVPRSVVVSPSCSKLTSSTSPTCASLDEVGPLHIQSFN
jgi:outer membrane protein TolC